MKRIKIDSYEVQRQKQYKKQQEELKQLLSNGASEDNKSSNTYKDRQQYTYYKELQRLEEIRHSYYISGNKSKLDKIDKEIEEHKRTYRTKERKKIINNIKLSLVDLYHSYKSKDR